uniref:Uncharacterized protein n=1 Tax=Arundo donax TaxID=35708 RepID=A0A0A9ABT1_ARUDO
MWNLIAFLHVKLIP